MVLWNSDMFIYSQFPATAMLSWLSFHSFIGINVNMFKVFDTSHPEICCQFWCLLYLFKSPDHQSDSSKTVIIIRPVVYRPFSLILKLHVYIVYISLVPNPTQALTGELKDRVEPYKLKKST